jgi:hypothetical protein
MKTSLGGERHVVRAEGARSSDPDVVQLPRRAYFTL